MTPIQPENTDKKMTAESTIPKCELSNEELIAKLRNWNSKLCDTDGKAWVLKVPVDINNDPDVLIEEVCQRVEQTASLREELEKVKLELKFEQDKLNYSERIFSKEKNQLKQISDQMASNLDSVLKVYGKHLSGIAKDMIEITLEKYNELNK